MPRRSRDRLRVAQVLRRLGRGLMEGLQGGSGQLELSAGLERDGAAGLLEQSDRVTVLHDRLPAGERLHPIEERTDAAVAVIGHGRRIGPVERHLLVLGAEPPGVARLLAGRDPLDEFGSRSDGGRIGNVARHASPHAAAVGTATLACRHPN